MIPSLVACFDVATTTGVCLGRSGDSPRITAWDLREAGPSRSHRLLYFSSLCDELFRRHHIDVVAFEAPLAIAIAAKIGASEETMLLLRGAIGVLESRAAKVDIKDIRPFNVQDARQHFLGRRTFPKDKNGKSTAKAEVMKMAKVLGVEVPDDNGADAFCGWSYICALLNPRLAHLDTPLFASVVSQWQRT